MKNTMMQSLMAVVSAGMLSAGGLARANAAAESEIQRFHGTITEIDKVNKTITGDGFWFWSSPRFHLGDECLILMQDKSKASLDDLRPGQRVQVRYQELGGVKVAQQITEQQLEFAGRITSLDREEGSLKIKDRLVTKRFTMPPECRVLGREGSALDKSDLDLGHVVHVTYLDTKSGRQATQIRQESLSFTGALEALDADTRWIRIQHHLVEKKFNLAEDCPVVVRNQPEGDLGDLRIGDKLVVHYEILDGVMVANRVERKETGTGPGEVPANQAKRATPQGP